MMLTQPCDVLCSVTCPKLGAGPQDLPCQTSATLRRDTAAPVAEPFLPYLGVP
jgi:hypothetical protein